MTDLMDRDHAQALLAACDADARLLSRKPRYELAAIERGEQAAIGITHVFGGPHSKDELVRSILDIRYPPQRMTEAGHVAHHAPGERWSACPHCSCQVTWQTTSAIVTGCQVLVQCELAPGHDGAHKGTSGGCEHVLTITRVPA